MTTLNDLAPYPSTADADHASLGKYLATRAAAEASAAKTNPDPANPLYMARRDAVTALFAAAAALRQLASVNEALADEVAHAIVDAWQDAVTIDELLWEWLTEDGIDPDAVERLGRAAGETKLAVAS